MIRTKVKINKLEKEGYIDYQSELSKNTEYYVRWKPRENGGYVGKFFNSNELTIIK